MDQLGRERMGPSSPTASALSLLNLPAEILMKVLTLLQSHDWAQAAQTCKAFHMLCNSVLGTRTFLDLKNPGAILDDPLFGSLSRRLGTKLRRLELDCWHLSDSSLRNLPRSVEELALCGCDHHSNMIVSHVADKLDGKLRLFAWSGFGGTISAQGFEDLAMKCRGLTSFMFDSGSNVDVNRVVRAIAVNSPLLTELSAYDLTKETLDFLEKYISLKRFRHKRRQEAGFPLTDAILLLLSGMCPLLEELRLVDKTDLDRYEDITDVGLLGLAERAPTLRILKMKLAQPNDSCSEIAVMQLANVCSNLTHVELSNFRRLGDPLVYELIQKCPKLVEVSLEGTPITDTSLDLLAQYCKHLRSISVKSCKKLTDVGLKALGLCGGLEAVNVGQASGLTDAAAIAICAGNPRLKTLVLSYGQVTDRALEAVSTCTHMRELALHNCSRITNHGLNMIAEGCPILRYISLTYCEQISDSGVVSLASKCLRLSKIRLDGCRLLSDPSVRMLCSSNQKLRHLSMQHCIKLSDNVFHHLLAAPSLRFVDLGRAKLTPMAMSCYHQQRPLVELYIDGRPFFSYAQNANE